MNSGNDTEKSSQYISCPSCKQPIRFKNNSYCPSCNRYQSVKKDSLATPDFLEPQDSGNYIFISPWVKTRSNRYYKWGALFTFIVFPFIMWLEGSLFEPWSSQEYSRMIISLVCGYAFLLMHFNKTRIEISSGRLLVKKGPVPVPLASSYEEKSEEMGRLDLYKVPGYRRTPEHFSIYLTLKDGSAREILSQEDELETIEFYEFMRTLWNINDNIYEITRENYKNQLDSGKYYLTSIYQFGFIAALLLNIPAIYLIKTWTFNITFLITFSVTTFFIFLIFYYHHRKYLNIWNSLPLTEGEKNPGIIGYFFLSLVVSLLLLPVSMIVSVWIG